MAPISSAMESHKPNNSLFKQQRLPAWQPVMTPPYVAGCLILIAVFFVPIGVSIIIANNQTQKIEFRYDDKCAVRGVSAATSARTIPFQYPNGTWGVSYQGCLTNVTFTPEADMVPPVYLYYKLTNFYQNHRRFVRSRSESQLAGSDRTKSQLTDCDPMLSPAANAAQLTIGASNYSYDDMMYAPCGLVAWSMFNDSFALTEAASGRVVCNTSEFDRTKNGAPKSPQNCTKAGITWESDQDKFSAPPFANNLWTSLRSQYTPSVTAASVNLNTTDLYLRNGWYSQEIGHEIPTITDLDFIVWSRTASLPTFLKLFRIINTTLKKDTAYNMWIYDTYPVSAFGGTKSFSIQTTSWIGGRNDFLGIAYVVIGGFCVVLAIVLYVLYKILPNRIEDAKAQLDADN